MASKAGRWIGAGLALLLLGCGTDADFIGSRTRDACEDSYPVCNTAAGCVLDEDHFTDGSLPGEKQVIFRTPGPALVRVLLLFTEERSPGRTTEIEWNEVGCGSQQSFSIQGMDVFQLAGDAQQIGAEKHLTSAGDHMVRLSSDATARYQMRVEIVK